MRRFIKIITLFLVGFSFAPSIYSQDLKHKRDDNSFEFGVNYTFLSKNYFKGSSPSKGIGIEFQTTHLSCHAVSLKLDKFKGSYFITNQNRKQEIENKDLWIQLSYKRYFLDFINLRPYFAVSAGIESHKSTNKDFIPPSIELEYLGSTTSYNGLLFFSGGIEISLHKKGALCLQSILNLIPHPTHNSNVNRFKLLNSIGYKYKL